MSVLKASFILSTLLLTACAANPVVEYNNWLIEALVERGSDVNKEHPVRYHRSCEVKTDVKQVIKLARLEGFKAEPVKYFASDDHWYTALRKSSQSKIEPIIASLDRLGGLQKGLSCSKVTWGSEVVK